MILYLFFSFLFPSSTAAAAQSSQAYNARMGFEVELDDLQHTGKRQKIQESPDHWWTLDTDSPKGANFFDVEYTTQPVNVRSDYPGTYAEQILANFRTIIQNQDQHGLTIKNQSNVNHMRPQITFQLPLKLIPILLNHLYIVSDHEGLKCLVAHPAWGHISDLNNLSSVNGLLALFLLYVNRLFETSQHSNPGLKSRLPVMSRFSFSKMYHSLNQTEKLEFERRILEIFQAAYQAKRIILYDDYDTPKHQQALILSIEDWITSIKKLPVVQNLSIIKQELLKRSEIILEEELSRLGFNVVELGDDRRIRDILSPPPNLGRDENETGMGAGDFFPNLQEDVYGQALVEIRLYGSATTLSKFNNPLTIQKLPALVSIEQSHLSYLTLDQKLADIRAMEYVSIRKFHDYNLFDETDWNKANQRIDQIYGKIP